tara:strand:- start:4931 stop:7627 length:2697 start_codon:yes stop_codon:yes gene_type:complete
MASLTGNSISSTYTSLIKVGDNGTLASSLQSITDGDGNSSGLSMNTGGDLTATGTITANAFSGPLTGNVTGTASLASNLTGTPNISVGTITASGTITGNVTGNVTGNITGNVTGNVSGSSGSTTGNAATATALETARTIAGVSFDGTANISLDTSNITENASFLYYTAERVDDQANTLIQAGTGISKTYDDAGGTLTITNTAPDQTVALTGGTGITTSGTYPNFTITNDSPDQTVSLSAGTGITVSGTYPNFTIANSGAGIALTDLSATDAGGLGSFSYNNGSGVFTYTGPSDSDVRTLISVTDAGGDGSLAYNNSSGVITYTGPSSSEVQAHITKTYVDGLGIAASTAATLATPRTINGTSFDGSANISFDTDSVSEGSSNLYYTAERVDDQANTLIQAGTGISKTYDDAGGTLTIANTSPDQTVAITGGTGITASGTYPNFTITNSAPDQTVALTGGSNVTVSGTYPSFTIAATDTQTDSFKTISVSGQSDIVADSSTDTLTMAAGSNVTLTTNAGTDTLTIAATDTNTTYSAGTGLALAGTTFSLDAGLNNLTDVNLTSPAAGHILIYDNTNSYFENATLTAGSNITITEGDGAITIAATNTNTDSFKTISVSGQSDLVADSATDTLTIAAGSNVTLTTNAGTDTLTIAATDTNTTYTAGSGLTLAGTEFSLTNNSVTIGGSSLALGGSLTATSGSLTIGGNGSSGGVTIDDGSIQVRSNTGNVAEMRFYCEVSNAHYQTVKAAPHSASSSAVLVLPTASGNLVGTGDTSSVATAMISDDAITSDKLGAEYTSAQAVTSAATITLDTDAYDVFTWTVGHTANIDFTNVVIGKVKTLVVTGGGSSYALTLRNINGSTGTFNKISGTYDDTSSTKNIIQIKFISTSEAWYTISKIGS